METRNYEAELEFQEDILGSIPVNKEVYKAYIATKAPEGTAEEETMADIEEKGWTTFYRSPDGRPCLMDYQIKGFLKEAGNTLKEQLGQTEKGNTSVFKALRSHIDNEVFVRPRHIPLADDIDGTMERPLRAMTMQGPRVTVVRSDYISAPFSVTVQLKVLAHSKITFATLSEIFEYGELKGLGQWRNGSYGQFIAKLREIN